LHVVIGLGNPGQRYARTRHNIGFIIVDLLAAGGSTWRDGAAQSRIAVTEAAGAEVLLVKPQTYMNRSGVAVAALRRQYEFELDRALVVCDDFLLDFGRLRLRRAGSDGGHNGLASVLEELGTAAVPRLRVGVGPVPEGGDDIDFVLADFGAGEDVGALADRGRGAAISWVADGVDVAMNQFNGTPPL